MTTIYIFTLDDNTHVATVTGKNNLACEKAAEALYCSNDYGWTYSPAFGFAGGLVENSDAEEIDADEIDCTPSQS